VADLVDCFGLTDQGRVRRSNEDHFLIADLDKAMRVVQTSLAADDRARLSGTHHGKMLLVADGMGGRRGGEIASGVAVETVARYALHTMPWFFQLQDGREADLEHELKAALEDCERSVDTAARATDHPGMGTTVTMAYLLWPRLYVVHAGDSRCYLARGGRLHQITRDHTVAQQMVDRGIITPEQADGSRWSHALFNCVGGGVSVVRPEVYKANLKAGDSVLLCSDGLSKYVPEGEIAGILEREASVEGVARRLIDAANAAGGSDNITVVVARLGRDATSSAATPADGTAFLPAG